MYPSRTKVEPEVQEAIKNAVQFLSQLAAHIGNEQFHSMRGLSESSWNLGRERYLQRRREATEAYELVPRQIEFYKRTLIKLLKDQYSSAELMRVNNTTERVMLVSNAVALLGERKKYPDLDFYKTSLFNAIAQGESFAHLLREQYRAQADAQMPTPEEYAKTLDFRLNLATFKPLVSAQQLQSQYKELKDEQAALASKERELRDARFVFFRKSKLEDVAQQARLVHLKLTSPCSLFTYVPTYLGEGILDHADYAGLHKGDQVVSELAGTMITRA